MVRIPQAGGFHGKKASCLMVPSTRWLYDPPVVVHPWALQPNMHGRRMESGDVNHPKLGTNKNTGFLKD